MNAGLLIAFVCFVIYQIADAYSADSKNDYKEGCRKSCKSECGINCDCGKGLTDD